jgi:hypothetical protein
VTARARLWLGLAWLATLTLVVPSPSSTAHAQLPAKLATRSVQVAWQAGAPAITYSAKDFADAAVLRKLQNGLPQTFVVKLFAFRDRGQEPIAASALSCRVIYDLWEGVYRIERQTDTSDRTLSAKSVDGVLQQCLQGQAQRFADTAAFTKQRGARVYFAFLIELNPLSKDTVQRIRRWLSRPGTNPLDGNAFFGSFVSIFVNRKLGAAEKSLAFRSDWYVVPDGSAPP